MSKGEAVNWIINLTADIGKIEHQSLWHYEQALSEIREMLETEPERKTGWWIWQTEDKYECSCCHEVIQVKEVMNVPQYITCPMCDAKMEVEHD